MATRAVKMSSDESQGGSGSELTKKVTGTIANTREFLHDVRVEMKQVTWPSREDVVATTWVVIATVAFFGVFLAVVDKLVQLGVAYVFKRFGV
jgi:preprotein translocase subunit SecE